MLGYKMVVMKLLYLNCAGSEKSVFCRCSYKCVTKSPCSVQCLIRACSFCPSISCVFPDDVTFENIFFTDHINAFFTRRVNPQPSWFMAFVFKNYQWFRNHPGIHQQTPLSGLYAFAVKTNPVMWSYHTQSDTIQI